MDAVDRDVETEVRLESPRRATEVQHLRESHGFDEIEIGVLVEVAQHLAQLHGVELFLGDHLARVFFQVHAGTGYAL